MPVNVALVKLQFGAAECKSDASDHRALEKSAPSSVHFFHTDLLRSAPTNEATNR